LSANLAKCWTLKELVAPYAGHRLITQPVNGNRTPAGSQVDILAGLPDHAQAPGHVCQAVPELCVDGLSMDSRLVQPGDAYLAIKGATTHGIRFAAAAVKLGAVAVVTSDDVLQVYPEIITELQALDVFVVALPGMDTLCADMANRFYNAPDQSMTLIAVTGTDGKTSVCRFLAEAFEHVQLSCGYIGTLGWGLGESLQNTQLTTPDIVSVRRMLAQLRDQGACCVALEASSHGLAEGRLEGLSIDVAVLTNLGRDHLDYHGTLEAYKQAKSSLFFWDGLQAVVLNADSEFGVELLASINSANVSKAAARFAYTSDCVQRDLPGRPLSLVSASAVSVKGSGLNFLLQETRIEKTTQDTRLAPHSVASGLLGRFNVDNLLACYAAMRACGVAANDASHCLSKVTPVAGRMEHLGGGHLPSVVVDYCHTPQALGVALNAVRVHAEKKIWVVFGCGGDRDAGKRPDMARAAEAADYVVLTDDNPRTEASQQIFNDALAGFAHPESANVIANRSEAIRFAITQAKQGDVVLIAGKGHEDYQIVGTTRHHFSDREQALKALAAVSDSGSAS